MQYYISNNSLKKSNNLTFPFDNTDIVIGEYDAVLLVVPSGVTAPHWSPGAVGVPPAGSEY